jgi:Na+/H+-dicarboxylate symporter
LVGDCFSISILALTILVSFGHPLPTLEEYMLFTVFFVLAKFAVAAVPGGGILVMIPILEKYLGFTPEMLSLITALYILFDPIVTSANVLGNGAFAQIFEKIYHVFHKEKKVSSWAN